MTDTGYLFFEELGEGYRVRVTPGHPYNFATLQKHSHGEWDAVADAIVRGDVHDPDNVRDTLKLVGWF